MMSLFTKALQPLSSVTATALSTTSNILLSGAASRTIFTESLSLKWLLGATLLIVGTGCLTAASADGSQSEDLKQA